ncbi:hypothetical protein M409DRAFT_15957 [Zasmidium cellare ATCC 36951]|uniref:Uncharacterized protein n=1 Tax=Zasmidium cellare ATCC 36951 TaxID=1080233 RepID=A0A6A6D2R7_ZASCE|nr:uncharacterized protein M409DRAFT_15957 [Zasmidium cellare ATCC 36951]KAF2173681.1 hypothetical protein M409DRAFT_15957 [Zasmidium cellare ATCC 36951]
MADSPFIEDPVLRAKALREYPYDFPYYDWCLTTLEIDPKFDLQKLPEWDDSLQHLRNAVGCKTVLWGCDLEQTHFVVVLARVTADRDIRQRTISVWSELDPFLLSSPRTRQIVLNIEDRFPGPSEVHELVLIDGNQELITYRFLHNVDFFTSKAMPMISHDPPVELAGCARGITHPNADGRNTIAILYTWLGME